MVAEAAVREDVGEQQAAGFQPAGDVREQPLVVFQMLEHLHGYDAIEPAGLDVESVDVGGDDPEVGEAALFRLGVDVLLLRAGIRDRGDLRGGKFFGVVEREGTPAAAEFEDVLAVGEPGALGVEREHRVLGLIERLAAGRVEAAGVF